MNTNNPEDVYICPSFNSYSSDRLAEIAVRIAGNRDEVAADDEDFEFAFVREENNEVLAEECQIGPVFPVFNRDLFNEDEVSEASVAIPLSKLFVEEDNERDDNNNNPPSCSSSEADELEQIPAGTYCVWRPKLAESPRLPSQCKKSKSTGSSSRRWRLRDLMRRSNSDGKDSFVFLTPKHNHHHELNKSDKPIQSPKGSKGNTPLRSSGAGSPSAHEAFYVRSRAMNAAAKKKSYLPYRQDLVGFFANVNGLRRSFPRF